MERRRFLGQTSFTLLGLAVQSDLFASRVWMKTALASNEDTYTIPPPFLPAVNHLIYLRMNDEQKFLHNIGMLSYLSDRVPFRNGPLSATEVEYIVRTKTDTLPLETNRSLKLENWDGLSTAGSLLSLAGGKGGVILGLLSLGMGSTATWVRQKLLDANDAEKLRRMALRLYNTKDGRHRFEEARKAGTEVFTTSISKEALKEILQELETNLEAASEERITEPESNPPRAASVSDPSHPDDDRLFTDLLEQVEAYSDDYAKRVLEFRASYYAKQQELKAEKEHAKLLIGKVSKFASLVIQDSFDPKSARVVQALTDSIFELAILSVSGTPVTAAFWAASAVGLVSSLFGMGSDKKNEWLQDQLRLLQNKITNIERGLVGISDNQKLLFSKMQELLALAMETQYDVEYVKKELENTRTILIASFNNLALESDINESLKTYLENLEGFAIKKKKGLNLSDNDIKECREALQAIRNYASVNLTESKYHVFDPNAFVDNRGFSDQIIGSVNATRYNSIYDCLNGLNYFGAIITPGWQKLPTVPYLPGMLKSIELFLFWRYSIPEFNVHPNYGDGFAFNVRLEQVVRTTQETLTKAINPYFLNLGLEEYKKLAGKTQELIYLHMVRKLYSFKRRVVAPDALHPFNNLRLKATSFKQETHLRSLFGAISVDGDLSSFDEASGWTVTRDTVGYLGKKEIAIKSSLLETLLKLDLISISETNAPKYANPLFSYQKKALLYQHFKVPIEKRIWRSAQLKRMTIKKGVFAGVSIEFSEARALHDWYDKINEAPLYELGLNPNQWWDVSNSLKIIKSFYTELRFDGVDYSKFPNYAPPRESWREQCKRIFKSRHFGATEGMFPVDDKNIYFFLIYLLLEEIERFKGELLTDFKDQYDLKFPNHRELNSHMEALDRTGPAMRFFALLNDKLNSGDNTIYLLDYLNRIYRSFDLIKTLDLVDDQSLVRFHTMYDSLLQREFDKFSHDLEAKELQEVTARSLETIIKKENAWYGNYDTDFKRMISDNVLYRLDENDMIDNLALLLKIQFHETILDLENSIRICGDTCEPSEPMIERALQHLQTYRNYYKLD